MIACGCCTTATTSCSCRSRISRCCRASAAETAGVALDKLGGVVLADAQGQGQAAHPRHGGRAHPHCRRTAVARGRQPGPGRGHAGTSSAPASPSRRPRTRRRAIADVLEDHGRRPADGSADLRRCRLRQDRSGAARRLRRRDVGHSGRRRGADDAARAPAFPHLLGALRRAADQGRAALADGDGQGSGGGARAAWPMARSISWSARTRCWPSRSSSPISAW